MMFFNKSLNSCGYKYLGHIDILFLNIWEKGFYISNIWVILIFYI